MAAQMIYVTAASPEQAQAIAEALVQERLVACANVIAPVSSVYWWQGRVQRDTEAVLIAKTRAERVDQIIARVRELHSYTVPCVVSLPIEQGNPAFLQWIEVETRPAAGKA